MVHAESNTREKLNVSKGLIKRKRFIGTENEKDIQIASILLLITSTKQS